MAGFKIYTAAGASPATYKHEMEALEPLGVQIVEAPAAEDAFIEAAKDADAVYGRGTKITKRVIDALPNLKIISLGSVGVDLVDVAAATAKGVPVTNCPDTFIEEVADHAMMLILATHRRLIVQDQLVREGRWSEGRPMLSKIPRLRGMTLGLIAFGHVACAAVKPRASATAAIAMMRLIMKVFLRKVRTRSVWCSTVWRILGQESETAQAARRRAYTRTGSVR